MDLGALQSILGYTFKNPVLLQQALTHRSSSRDGTTPHNQRLEFLGDAVLGMIIAELLYQRFPDEAEGDLSKRQVSLVNGEQLSAIATTMKLGEFLQLGDGEEEQGGRENPSNLEDACEALLGAAYLDGGIPAVSLIVDRFWSEMLESTKNPPKDPKTSLQEWVQARGLPLPEYRLISADGPSHAPHFVIDVMVQGQEPARGEAGTKRLAERQAASSLLSRLNA